ncbi:hypothetical protein PIB30_095789 [Stylosanthes scabra]|uniref:Uncharacterized protein n=1 Tax=Stylosanthes scabra TaxID=79078 RepID=A0ABU6RVU5_9FABA|nr:hypothetical protein [Stylosanthes scabra]
MLIPRAGNHGTVSEEDMIILLVMVEEVRLNWPLLLAYQLYYYSIRQVESGLGHGILWTKVFEYQGFLSPELMESFSQGIQSFHSAWGENSLDLGRRLDGFETQLTRHGEEIHGLGADVRGWFDQFPRSGNQGSHGDAPSQG